MYERCSRAQPDRVRQRLEQLASLVNATDERVFQLQAVSDSYARSLHDLEARTKEASKWMIDTKRRREKSE
jgi:hypothetical protein|tara:strand:+ start:449 stop:661 length:213 start_codon:yes stop_codon:yes gene_type:complete